MKIITLTEAELKNIVSECVHTELRKHQRLDEMARVGVMGNTLDVVVYTDDMGYVPHVHIIDTATRGCDFDCCVQLEHNQYFTHGTHQDTFNSRMCKQFNDFMHQPCRSPKYRNNYEFAVEMWNANNSNSYVQIQEDNEGNIIQPNYSTIASYKS